MKTEPKILIVACDDASCQLLKRDLAEQGNYLVSGVTSARTALSLLGNDQFAAILVETTLPEMGGSDFCRLVRRQRIRNPILVFGAGGDADVVLALEAGANDYMVTPFNTAVLLARLRAHLRQHGESDDATLPLGRFLFRPGVKLLVDPAAKKKMRLTELETAMLKYLYRAGDQPTPREKLLAEVWGYDRTANTHTIESHVHRLRRKLERDPRKAELLVTESGGYRLAKDWQGATA
jgi:DNA-binding response OmpR family regulator